MELLERVLPRGHAPRNATEVWRREHDSSPENPLGYVDAARVREIVGWKET